MAAVYNTEGHDILVIYSSLFATRVEETTRQINKQKRKENLTKLNYKVQNTLHQSNIIYTLDFKSVVQVTL